MKILTNENNRFLFVCDRDGIASGYDFAEQTLKIYKRCIQATVDGFPKNLAVYGKAYKTELLKSITELELILDCMVYEKYNLSNEELKTIEHYGEM